MWMERKGSWVRLVADGPGRVIKMNDGRWELSKRRGGAGYRGQADGADIQGISRGKGCCA